MRQVISVGLISAVLFGTVLPAAGQDVRQVKSVNVHASEPANQFADVRAFSDGNGVLVEWKMGRETNNLGFEVYRLDGRRSVKVSSSMIPGSALMYGERPVANERYTYFDADGTPSSVYYVKYFPMKGGSDSSRPAAVETVADLSEVGSVSSEALHRQVAERKSNSNVTAQELMYPKPLAQEVLANKPSADASTHAWVVTRPGVRIGVRRDGLYRVTRAELQNAGFDVNADSNLWQLYREGVEHALLLGPNADYIEFYGKGQDTTETDMSVYFLVVGQSAGKRMGAKVARPYSGTFTSPNYNQASLQKPRTLYSSQILNGETENYFGPIFTSSTSANYNFTLTGVDFNVAQAQLEIKFHGFSFHQHDVSIVLNGETLTPASGNSRSPYSANYTIPTSFLREGANTLVLKETTPPPPPAVSSSSFLDSVKVSFARKQLATQDRLRFYTNNYRLSKLIGFTSPNIRVFDLTNENEPVLWTNLNVIPENGTHSVRMPADRGRSMYAVSDPGLQTVASISSFDTAVLKSSSNAANLVIISHKNWLAQAEAWANYRRGQGFTVKVVDIDEIYDEFSFGDFESLAIRGFLQYAKNNWQTAPGYALLLGDASYDFRNYQGLGYNNFVPAHLVDTVFTEAGSDDTLADFNGDGLADIAIGRITARTGQTVTDALARVTLWEQSAPTLQGRGILFASDQYDSTNNYDFEEISLRLRNTLPANVPTVMIGLDDTPPPPDTPQSLLLSSMNSGKYLVNYSGHGSLGAWSNGGAFFSSLIVPQLTNAGNPSIFTMLTCLNGNFVHASNRSLAENLVEATNGGAVAAWASTGETTPDVQETMATRFFLKLGQGQILRLGDLVNDAKSVIPGGTDVKLSWALIGDPMLKVQNPSGGDRPARKR